MKKLVLTASFGDRPFTKYTVDSIEKYAKKIGAHFKNVESFEIDPEYSTIKVGRKNNTAYLLKMLVIQQAFEEYDRILWLDDTCIVSKDCPDLFKHVPVECVGAHNEGILKWTTADETTRRGFNKIGLDNLIDYHNYLNTGVMVLSKAHSPMFIKENILSLGKKGFFNNGYPTQTYLNYLIHSTYTPWLGLSPLFNRMILNIPSFQGERINYETQTPKQMAVAGLIDDFSFLNDESTALGKPNGAYIYHLVSFYSTEKRLEISKRLHALKVEQ